MSNNIPTMPNILKIRENQLLYCIGRCVMETIARKITDFLVCRNCIKEEEKEICQYGYEILLSTFLGYTIVLLLSLLFGNLIEGLVFLFVFVLTRMYTGGYHAKTYLTCNICLACTYLLYMGMVYILKYSHGSNILLLLMLTVYCLCTIWFTPIENPNKVLTEKKKKKVRKISQILMTIWSILAISLMFFNNEIGIMIIVTVFIVAILMIKEVYGK